MGLPRLRLTVVVTDHSLTHGSPSDPCWVDPDESVLLEAVDQLHDASSISDPLWDRLSDAYLPAQLLDLTMLCGWYHAISFSEVSGSGRVRVVCATV